MKCPTPWNEQMKKQMGHKKPGSPMRGKKYPLNIFPA